ncbi:MAG: FAD-dependent oxidoreductase [Pseudomonadota bacterium]
MTDAARSTDVVILGAGASGLCAALTAYEQGAEVLLLEKSDLVGGTAAISGGVIWAPDNPVMRRAGLSDSAAAARAYFESLAPGQLDPPVLDAFLDHCSETLAFLEREAPLEFSLLEGYPDYYLDRPGALEGGGRALDNGLFSFLELGEWRERVRHNGSPYPLMLRETPLGGATGAVDPQELARRVANDERGFGQALIGGLLKACLDRGIEPQLETDVLRLHRSGDRIAGVVIRADDGEQVIHARHGVLICTGGFEWNEQLRTTFLKGPLTHPASPPTNQGDGLKLAMEAGAQLGNMTSAWWAPTLAIPDDEWFGEQRATPVLLERTAPHSIIVNRAGKRFCNEAANYSALAGAFHYQDPNAYATVNLPCWVLFDAQYRERYPVGPLQPGEPLPDWIHTAPTLSALAQALGIDGAALENTVRQFNADVAAGADTQFQRGASPYDRFYGDRSRPGAAATLGPLEQAPFFAIELKIGALGTNGGPRTDAEGRVLNQQGAVIPGLYAAGNAMAGPTGPVYAGAGGTLGPALTSGYLCGRAAARGAGNRLG